jgi:hypothetical protein
MKVILRSAITIIYISSFLIILHNTTFAQAPDTLWIKIYDGAFGDKGFDIKQSSDGGYIITGVTGNNFYSNDIDLWLIRTDENGDTLWTRTFGGDSSDAGYSVAETSDGGYIITGRTMSYGADFNDVWLIKTNASGDSLWTKTFEGRSGQSIYETNDGGYVFIGSKLIKTDPNGDTLWTKNHWGGRSLQLTNDGGYILTGKVVYNPWSLPYKQNSDVILVKTDEKGDTLWTKTFGGDGFDSGSSVQQTKDGGYIIAGTSHSFNTDGSTDVWLIKTNMNGDTLWTRTFSSADSVTDAGSSVHITEDGGYLIQGITYFSNRDLFLIKTDTDGNILWTKIVGGPFNDDGSSVIRALDNGYIITGGTQSCDSCYHDVWIVKIGAEITNMEEYRQTRKVYFLSPNYPNPFNPSTTIDFTLPKSEFVELRVFNILGKEVATLVSKKLNQGSHTYTFDGKNLASGIYYYQLMVGDYREVKKMILLK